MMAILLILFSVSISIATTLPIPEFKMRQIIDESLIFSQVSNATLVFISCGQVQMLRQSVLSFFYYNTYPLKEMILVDRCQTSQTALRSCLPQNSKKQSGNIQLFKVISFKGTEIQAMQTAFEKVSTKYVMYYHSKWVTFDGMGYIEQAIDAIEYGERNNIKISQATSLFPTWKNYRALSRFTKTEAGTIFFEIRTFKPVNRYYFTFNPSLINFEIVFRRVMNSNINSYSSKVNCADIDCLELALGRQLYEVNHYMQIFIDDGSINTKVYNLDQAKSPV